MEAFSRKDFPFDMNDSTSYGNVVSTMIEKFNTIYSMKSTPESGYGPVYPDEHYGNDCRTRENGIEDCGMGGSRSSKTFKPKKNLPDESYQCDLMKYSADTLGSGDLRLAVLLPEGGDLNEWVASNTVDFANQINMLYGTLTEFCTEEVCPIMSAGPKYEYHWADGHTVKKPIKCSAPKYIDFLMTWVQDQLDDATLFPAKRGIPFPKNFLSIVKTILRRLFRVYAHVYHEHFLDVLQLGEVAHLNTSFKHFIIFVNEFNLIDKRELAPLQELCEKYTGKDD